MKRQAVAETPIVITDTLDESVPVLFDGPPMDLPAAATLNADGSVTLTLQHPFDLVFQTVGSGRVATTDRYETLLLRRLTGGDVRKLTGSKNVVDAALALSSGLGLAKLNLVLKRMDAGDETAASDVVTELLGGAVQGLPANAEATDEGVTLTLLKPATDEQGQTHETLTFKRLTAAQRRAAGEAANLLDWGVAWATGLSPKVAKSLVDDMDGADAMGVIHAIRFLCASGPRTGR